MTTSFPLLSWALCCLVSHSQRHAVLDTGTKNTDFFFFLNTTLTLEHMLYNMINPFTLQFNDVRCVSPLILPAEAIPTCRLTEAAPDNAGGKDGRGWDPCPLITIHIAYDLIPVMIFCGRDWQRAGIGAGMTETGPWAAETCNATSEFQLPVFRLLACTAWRDPRVPGTSS